MEPNYVLLEAKTLTELKQYINTHILQGYVLQGGILATPIRINDGENIKYDYYQGMVKKEVLA